MFSVRRAASRPAFFSSTSRRSNSSATLTCFNIATASCSDIEILGPSGELASYQEENNTSTLVSTLATSHAEDFKIWPYFFSPVEHDVLLRSALRKLDLATSSKASRSARKAWLSRREPLAGSESRNASEKSYIHHSHQNDVDMERHSSAPAILLPDEAYVFENGHFDGVIHGYRECQVQHWPTSSSHSSQVNDSNMEAGGSAHEDEDGILSRALSRLYSLLDEHQHSNPPSSSSPLITPFNLLTHVLHLSSTGAIDPHVDNVDASGNTILGVSLGGYRIMYLDSVSSSKNVERIKILLRPGSVYLQRNAIRYKYTHSIPANASIHNKSFGPAPRVSIMMRNRHPGHGH